MPRPGIVVTDSEGKEKRKQKITSSLLNVRKMFDKKQFEHGISDGCLRNMPKLLAMLETEGS